MAAPAKPSLAFVGIIGAGILTGLLWARVFQDLWLWFVVTQWQVAPLAFWNTAGLLLMAHGVLFGLSRYEPGFAESDPAQLAFQRLIQSIIGALVTWGFGALYATLGGLR